MARGRNKLKSNEKFRFNFMWNSFSQKKTTHNFLNLSPRALFPCMLSIVQSTRTKMEPEFEIFPRFRRFENPPTKDRGRSDEYVEFERH